MGWTKGKLRGQPKPQYHCLHCNNEIPFRGYTYDHKFCDNQCQGAYRKATTLDRNIQLFEEGQLKSRPAIREVISHLRGYHCDICKTDGTWQDKPITLQVDHINGDPYDDSPANLRLLCPNCHSQTDTFTSKNKGRGRWSKENLKRYYKSD